MIILRFHAQGFLNHDSNQANEWNLWYAVDFDQRNNKSKYHFRLWFKYDHGWKTRVWNLGRDTPPHPPLSLYPDTKTENISIKSKLVRKNSKRWLKHYGDRSESTLFQWDPLGYSMFTSTFSSLVAAASTSSAISTSYILPIIKI